MNTAARVDNATRTRIKICGVREVKTALHAAACGADFIGLNRVEASPRCVTTEDAEVISAALRDRFPEVGRVGLFCDHAVDTVRNEMESFGLSIAQLHGHETWEHAAALAPLPVWKAVPFDPAAIDAWRNPPDNLKALLIDTPPQRGDLTGGSGRTFDWAALAALDRNGLPPIMLAGGLTPENVGEAVRVVRPWGVDVSSGVESSRGIKDRAKIAAFCEAVRAADAGMRGN